MGNYKANSAPKPWPVIVTPIVDLKNVLDVDQDKKIINHLCLFDNTVD